MHVWDMGNYSFCYYAVPNVIVGSFILYVDIYALIRGLSLVQKIVQSHSGTIDVQSIPGHTEFCMKSPVQTPNVREP